VSPAERVTVTLELIEPDYAALVAGGRYHASLYGAPPASDEAAAHLALRTFVEALRTAQRRPGSWERGALASMGLVDG